MTETVPVYTAPRTRLEGELADAVIQPTPIPDPADVLEGFSDGLYRVKRLPGGGWRITRVGS